MTEYTARIVIDRIAHACVPQPGGDDERLREPNVLYGRCSLAFDGRTTVRWTLSANGNEQPFNRCPYCGDELPQDIDPAVVTLDIVKAS